DAYVFTLRVTSKTPRRAAAEADALADSLVEALRRDADKYSSQHIEALTELRAKAFTRVEDIEARMRDLLASNQIASIQQEVEKATYRAAQLAQAQTDTRADLRQSEQKVAELGRQLRLFAPDASGQNAPVEGRTAALSAGDSNKFRSFPKLGQQLGDKLFHEKVLAEVATGGLRARLDSIEKSAALLV